MYDSDEPMGMESWFPDDELEADLESIPVHVLVAEDDSATRDLLVRAISAKGYRVSLARDGQEAWELLQNRDDPPELAILDWMMPMVDGPELCRRLKARKYPFVFTVLLTARTGGNDIIDGLDAGATSFSPSPSIFTCSPPAWRPGPGSFDWRSD